jgi:hypothetical protein
MTVRYCIRRKQIRTRHALYFQYTFSLLLYVVNKKHLFTKNLDVHNHDNRSANNFHLPITNLTKYQT